MNKLITRTLVSMCFIAATAPVAIAQSATAPSDRSRGFQESRHHQQRPFSLPSERVEAQLAYVKTALKIAGDQESQWNAYADVMRKLAREGDERVKSWRSGPKDRMQRQRPTAIERLERQQSFHAAAVTRLNEILAVQKPLYAALSPEQKLVADQVLVRHRPGGFRHGGSRRG